MIFKQFLDQGSQTFSYLIAESRGSEAIIIDSVQEHVEEYLQFAKENQLKIVKGFDTHTHADHVTGLSKLRTLTKCITIMGEESGANTVSIRVRDGDKITIKGLTFDVLHTPGHTDDSYSLYCQGMLFTGDTLFIRGTGRTDFQNGDANALYDSLFEKLLKYPDQTIVYPGHDYKGETLTTIGLEKETNPRLQVKSKEEFKKILDNLNLPNPKLMDIAVPANTSLGDDINDNLSADHIIDTEDAIPMVGDPDVVFIDLREEFEFKRDGIIPGSILLPFQDLDDACTNKDHPLQQAINKNKIIVFYCANGERSALTLEILADHGFDGCSHLRLGTTDWIKQGGPIEKLEYDSSESALSMLKKLF
jgi:sulfur dioxygenase